MLFESDYTGDASHATPTLQDSTFVPLSFDHQPIALGGDGEGNMLGLFGLEDLVIDESAWSRAMLVGFTADEGFDVAVDTAMSYQSAVVAGPSHRQEGVVIPATYSRSNLSTDVEPPRTFSENVPVASPRLSVPNSLSSALAMSHEIEHLRGQGYEPGIRSTWLGRGFPQLQPSNQLPSYTCFNAEILQPPNCANAEPHTSVADQLNVTSMDVAATMQYQINELSALLETRAPVFLQPSSSHAIAQIHPADSSFATPFTSNRSTTPATALPLPKAEIEVVDLTTSPSPPPLPSGPFHSPSKGGGSRPDWRLAELLSKRRPPPNFPGSPASSPRKRKATGDDEDGENSSQTSPTKRKKPSPSSSEEYAPAATVSMTPNGKGRAPAFDLSRKVVQAFKAQKAERMAKDVAFLSGPATLKAERERIKAVTEAESASSSAGMEMWMGTTGEEEKDTSTLASGGAAPSSSTTGSDVFGGSQMATEVGSSTFGMDLGHHPLPPMMRTTTSTTTDSSDEYCDDSRPLPPPVLNDDWLLQLLGVSSLDVPPDTGYTGHSSDAVLLGHTHINLNASQIELELGSPLFQSQPGEVLPGHDGMRCGRMYGNELKASVAASESSSLDLSSWLMDC